MQTQVRSHISLLSLFSASPMTQKFPEMLELFSRQPLCENVSLLEISFNLLEIDFIPQMFLEEMTFDCNVFGSWRHLWGSGCGQSSIVVLKHC